ncbi:MAG TPA: DUF5317 family protein [Candidatus Limnocylindrales bacterium]|nr:DUF5317 family protein [Candidatus Limnocylindrales bacterium]
MRILFALPVGVALGLLLGGRVDRLEHLRFRWPWLAIGGLLAQVVLFSDAGYALAGSLTPALYVVSTLAVLVAVARNLAQPGMLLVGLGALANLAAILANGGSMPADPGALALAGLSPVDHANSVVLANPALQPLTDVYAAPAWVPFANVFSVGDVLIGLGIAIAIAAAMRTRAPGGTTAPEVAPVPEVRPLPDAAPVPAVTPLPEVSPVDPPAARS